MDIQYPAVPTAQPIQTPPNAGPTYGLANSIDALFDSYQRTKVQNALLPGQVQAQALQNQGAQASLDAGNLAARLRNNGFSDAQIAQALADPQGGAPVPSYAPPAPPTGGQPSSLYAVPTQAPVQRTNLGGNVALDQAAGQPAPQGGAAPLSGAPGQPLGPQGSAPPPGQPAPLGAGPFGHPSVQDAASSLMRYAQAGKQLGAQEAQANLAKTQAEAAKTGAEAQLTEAQIAALGGSDSLTSNLVSQIQAGKMKLEDLSNLGRGELANALRVGVNAKLAAAGTNVAGLTNAIGAQGAGAKSGAELTQGGSAQEMARAANSAYKQFDLLQQASDNFSRSNNQLLNKPLLQVDATKYPEAQVFKTALSTARIEYARAASGSKSPSDTFMAEAKNALPDGITAAQIGPVLNQLRNRLAEQTRGQLSPATLQDAPPLTGGTAPPAPAANPKAAAIIQAGRAAGHTSAQIKTVLQAAGL